MRIDNKVSLVGNNVIVLKNDKTVSKFNFNTDFYATVCTRYFGFLSGKFFDV